MDMRSREGRSRGGMRYVYTAKLSFIALHFKSVSDNDGYGRMDATLPLPKPRFARARANISNCESMYDLSAMDQRN